MLRFIFFLGVGDVEAIFLDATKHTQINLRPEVFEKLVNLRLLAFRDHKRIKSVSLPHGLDLLPENLRYFLWDGYPLKSLPLTFCHEMLVELSLRGSHVEKLWNGVLVSMVHVFIIILFSILIKV